GGEGHRTTIGPGPSGAGGEASTLTPTLSRGEREPEEPARFSSLPARRRSVAVKTKGEIVRDWLPRYTGRPLEAFGRYILLSNFSNYIRLFAERFGVEVMGLDKPMQSATANDITIVNFGMGSAMAATVMDLLSAIKPAAVLLLGKCGGFKKTKVGDFVLPIAAIRGEGTSNDYMPPEIPALPSFRLQKAVSA